MAPGGAFQSRLAVGAAGAALALGLRTESLSAEVSPGLPGDAGLGRTGAGRLVPLGERGVFARGRCGWSIRAAGAAAGPWQRRAGSLRPPGLCGTALSAPSRRGGGVSAAGCAGQPLSGPPHLCEVCAARAALSGAVAKGQVRTAAHTPCPLCRRLPGLHPAPGALVGRWKGREDGSRGRTKRKGSAGREESGIPLCQR